jgi:hypothetical protein
MGGFKFQIDYWEVKLRKVEPEESRSQGRGLGPVLPLPFLLLLCFLCATHSCHHDALSTGPETQM